MDQSPEEIELEHHIFDIDFHPQQDIVAGAMVNGVVELYKYSEKQNAKVLELKYHSDSCRSVLFSNNGQTLYTASADKSIRAVDTAGSIEWAELNAHEHPVNVLKQIDANVIASGDDIGCIKVWDTRQHRCVVEWTDHSDYISDMTCNSALDHMLVTSGDGTLSSYDLRKNKLEGRSDDLEDELLSVVIGKNGKKVFCGSQEGVIVIFSWGTWGDMSDRFPGHPHSIDTMLKVDEDTICTGSSDGIIRIVQLHPNKLLGVIGDHEDFPIEVMKFSHDKRIIGSASHTNKLHFWDVGYLFEEDDEDDDEEDTMESDAPSKRLAACQDPNATFFDDL